MKRAKKKAPARPGRATTTRLQQQIRFAPVELLVHEARRYTSASELREHVFGPNVELLGVEDAGAYSTEWHGGLSGGRIGQERDSRQI
ncbi:MAG: hypothetical protein ABI895_07200 [Deltaproteobacteria bacterium]